MNKLLFQIIQDISTNKEFCNHFYDSLQLVAVYRRLNTYHYPLHE